MNLGLRFLIHPSATNTTNQHTIQPFSHRFSNQRSNKHLFRQVTFPDVLPRYSTHFQIAEGDFLKHRPDGELYDYIVTQFFIDTGPNIVATLTQIRELLKPGGKWINLGPLLWSSGGSVAMELNLEEVLALAKGIGFHIVGEDDEEEVDKRYRRRTVECEYTADKMGTFRRVYHAEFWVAKKA
jgi:hypothetical protein